MKLPWHYFAPGSAKFRAVFVIKDVAYAWEGWFGCQLVSYERTRKAAGEARSLTFDNMSDPVDVTLWRTKRVGLWVKHLWAVSNKGTHDEHVKRIETLRERLRGMV